MMPCGCLRIGQFVRQSVRAPDHAAQTAAIGLVDAFPAGACAEPPEPVTRNKMVRCVRRADPEVRPADPASDARTGRSALRTQMSR